MKTHISAGGVLYSPQKNKFYLIYKKERDEWLLPHGHIEEGQDLEETALRETQEETGYQNIEFISEDSLLGKIEHDFQDSDEKKAHKIVYYYLTCLKQEEFKETIQREKEGLTGAWFTFEQAMNLFKYENYKKILLKAKAKLIQCKDYIK